MKLLKSFGKEKAKEVNHYKRENENQKILLVLETEEKHDWKKTFAGTKINGNEVVVVQADWRSITLTGVSDFGKNRQTKVFVDVLHSTPFTISPDFLLIRSVVCVFKPEHNYRNLLHGFQFGDVPSVNSLHSVLCGIERPWVFGELLKIRKRLGRENFPLIPQNYYPEYRTMRFCGPTFPAVVKVGHAHAGYGKMIISDHHAFEDFSSIIALNKDYVTGEPFLKGKHDLRLQKIGDQYRAFKRTSLGNWKTNTGTSIIEDIEMTDLYKSWVDAASSIFGGLDICALDVLVTEDDEHFILELNDGAIGFSPDHQEEDMAAVRDVVVRKMREIFESLSNDKTNKQTSQTNKQTNKQTNTQTNKQTNKHTIKQTNKQTKWKVKEGPVGWHTLNIVTFTLVLLK